MFPVNLTDFHLSLIYVIEINSSIQWQRNGSLSIDDNCDDNDVMPDASCLVEISITNLGNFEDAFELTVDSTEWLTPILSRATTVVAKGETQETATLILIVNGMVPAFSHGQATITLKLNNGEILGSETVEKIRENGYRYANCHFKK